MSPAPALVVRGPAVPRADEILTPEALAFVADLQRGSGRGGTSCSDGGATAARRSPAPGGWTSSPRPRRSGRGRGRWRRRRPTCSTGGSRSPGPTEPKMAINALNSGAQVWLADLEDANTPHWAQRGRRAGRDATTSSGGTLRFEQADGQVVRAAGRPARRRRWSGRAAGTSTSGTSRWTASPRSARWSTSGCTSSTTPRELLARGSGPYFYLPKIESHLEARLWNDVFVAAQETSASRTGTIRATVLIETIPAAFEMEEILYELRDHVSGLNAGRWDYLFSIIKILPRRRAGVRAARPQRRDDDRAVHAGVHRAAGRRPATGAARSRSAAWRPSSRAAATPRSTSGRSPKVREDKEREAGDGFDGSWVAHPDLVPVCRGDLRPRCSATGPTSSTGCAPTCSSTAGRPARRRRRRASVTEAGPARQRRPSRCSTWRRGWAATARSRSTT